MIRRLTSLLSVAVIALGAEALDATFYGHSSPLSQGRWVKIGVEATGVYEISYADLKAYGFSDPSAVRVYGYGGVLANNHRLDGTVPDVLPLAPAVHTSDGRIVFYGEGTVRTEFKPGKDDRINVVRNPYDTRGYYFLSDCKSEDKIVTVPYTAGAKSSTWHYCIDLSEREVQHADDGSGVIFHGPRLEAGNSETATFRVRNFGWNETGTPRGIFEFEAAVNTNNKISLGIELSGASDIITDIRESSIVPYPQRLWVAATGGATFGADATNTLVDSRLTATVTLPSTFTGSYAAIDRCYLIYPQLNNIDSDMSELMLNYAEVTEPIEITLTGADSDVAVWDVTDPAAVRCLETEYDQAAMTAKSTMLPGDGTRRLVAFNPAQKHRQPHVVGVVDCQDLHAQESPEILIITTESLLERAIELAEIHRAQGQSTLVVTQEATFNEFGSGTRSSAAIRRAIKMFYDRSNGSMRHVILYGASSDDPRFIMEAPSDFLLTYICESEAECCVLYKNYVSDQYFGMMSDSFNPVKIEQERMQLSTGRIPVADDNEARTINAKIRNYFVDGPTPAMALRMFKSSDKFNDAIHLKYANQMANEMTSANELLTITHGDFALYDQADAETAEQPKAMLERALKRGVGMFYYTGHGGMTSLSNTDFYNMSSIENMHYAQHPLIVLASCLTYPYDRENHNLAYAAVLTPDGGSFGTIGACREVLLEYNRPFSNAVGWAYANAGGGTDAGEILKNARNRMIDQGIMKGDMAFNALCFNYCGDPALDLALPHFNIEIDDVGGDKFVSGKTFALNARVVDDNGAVIEDFNGPVNIEVFDGAIDRTSLVPAVTDVVSCDDNLLSEFTTIARNGIISANVYLPDPSQGHRPARIVVTASDPDSRRYAAGLIRKNGIEDPVEEQPDPSDAPEILSFMIADNDYIEPGVVKPNFSLHATIDPSSSGLAVGVSGIRNRVTIIVDGKDSNATVADGMRYNSDGTVSLSHQIIGASFGSHTYELRVVNNAGLSAVSTIKVNVGTPSHTGTLLTDAEDGTVRESLLIDLESSVAAKRLIVVDFAGNTVLSVNAPVFPYNWDLKDMKGQTVSDGHYKAWAMLADDLAHGSTPVKEFTVICGKISATEAPTGAADAVGKSLDLSDCHKIEAGAYAGSDIEQIILPTSGKLIIGEGAFAGSQIRKLVVNCDVEIGLGAFAACEQLESVVLNGEATVGEYAFRNCVRLKSADVHTVRSLPAKVFAGCASLADVTIGSGLEEIGVSTFEGCAISDIKLGGTSVKTIGAYAFNGNHALTSIQLPSSLTMIGEGAFFDCMSLKGIALPASCRELDNYSLKGASGVEQIALPQALSHIGRSAMEGMNGLKEIDASKLDNVPTLGEDVWYGLTQEAIKLLVTEETKGLFESAQQWQEFDIYYNHSSGVDEISTAPKLRGRMIDGFINLECDDDTIASVDVYNASGMLVHHSEPSMQKCDIDVTHSNTRVLIVRVELAGGACGSLKFVK